MSDRKDNSKDDINHNAYKSLVKNDFDRYNGQYVAFVDGELVGHDHDANKLLERVREKHKNKLRYFALVAEKETIDIPTPFLD